MNDLIVILILLAFAALALYSCLRRKKNGCGGCGNACGGDCGGCGGGCHCSDRDKPQH